MKLFVSVVLLVVAIIGHMGTMAQNPQQVQLTQDHIDMLREVLSPACKYEIDQALEMQAELSNACREEIQMTLSRPGPSGVNEFEDFQDYHEPRMASKPPPRRQKQSPTLVIAMVIGFTISMIAVIGGVSVYINQKRGKWGVKRAVGAKKLRKEMLAGMIKKSR